MVSIQILYVLTIISLSQAAYISRTINVNRRTPTVFRPGVMLQRPWTHQRIVPAASHRMPYVVYRGPIPHRYAMKPYNLNFRNVYSGGPWKTGRLPAPSTTEFMRTASAPPVLQTHGGPGAIHTIPAPNLSLSEKPIVVAETSEINVNAETSEGTKATYEVTEKYNEPTGYLAPAKIESPVGFSKQSPMTTPELHPFIHTGAALHLPMQYAGSSLSHNPISPQQFSMPGFTELTGHQDLIQTAAEGIIIPPSALYQNDPNFLQKLQSHLLQQFPSVEFIPYAADTQVKQTSPQPELFLLENEVMPKRAPIAFKPSDYHKNIVQRETQESAIISLPQPFTVANATENFVNATLDQPQNATQIFISDPEQTTTVKNDDTTTEEQKTTIYYAQVGQSVGNVIAKGFYSAINDVRAAAAVAQDEKLEDKIPENTSTTTAKTETDQSVNVDSLKESNNGADKDANKQQFQEINNQQFELHEDAPNVTYTLLRSPEQQSKSNKDSDIYTGQMVQAMVSEDKDYNKEKVNTVSWRPPLRLYAIQEKKTENVPTKLTVIKAKIPPKSKLTFDNKTGEPVLRIYASYSENPMQKEVILSKLSNNKHFKEGGTRKQESGDANKASTMKTFDKKTNDANPMAQFGQKLRSRSDDYIPLFEEYEE